jgi:hypothetical protein
VPVHRWHPAEAASSAASSASCYDVAEHIRIVAVIMAELELRQVERQVLLADVVVRPNDAALQQRPERFDAVGVNLPAHILASAMADGFMSKAYGVQMRVTAMLIGCYKVNGPADSLANEATKRRSIGVVDYLANHIALSADRADDTNLARAESAGNMSLFVRMAILVLAANERFIYFHNTHQLREPIILHRGANAMAHIPSSLFLFESHDALNIQGTDPLFGIQHQEGNHKPFAQRSLCVLKDRPADNAEAVAVALVASGHFASLLVHGLSAALANPMIRAMGNVKDFCVTALRAAHAFGPALRFQIFLASGFVGELLQQVFERHEKNYSEFLVWCQLGENPPR